MAEKRSTYLNTKLSSCFFLGGLFFTGSGCILGLGGLSGMLNLGRLNLGNSIGAATFFGAAFFFCGGGGVDFCFGASLPLLKNWGSSIFASGGGRSDEPCCLGGTGGEGGLTSAVTSYSGSLIPISSSFLAGMLTTSSTVSTTSSTAPSIASSTDSAMRPGVALISSTVSSTLRFVASATFPGVA